MYDTLHKINLIKHGNIKNNGNQTNLHYNTNSVNELIITLRTTSTYKIFAEHFSENLSRTEFLLNYKVRINIK